jgi:hypothetical protein
MMYQYINFNVNYFTLESGDEGRQTISGLCKNALEIGVIKPVPKTYLSNRYKPHPLTPSPNWRRGTRQPIL